MPAWNVTQKVFVEAPASKVYEAVSDYRTWTTWSPWLIADPQAITKVSEVPDAVGSTYHWEGTVVG